MSLEHELGPDSNIVVVYDGDCPLCNNYIRMMRLGAVAGRPSLINARERPELVKALAESGVNLDEGMAVYYQGRIYAGSEAINLLAMLTTPSDFANWVAATVLGRPAIARALYPFLRAGRNVLLKLKGKPQFAG